MILLFFSDNHRDRETLDVILKRHPSADLRISLGDSEMPEAELTELGVFGVRGNYPFEPKFPEDLFLEFEGWKVFMTHGHRYSVKNGLHYLDEKAESLEADIVLFGHTHRALLETIGERIFANPGSLRFPKGFAGATYLLADLTAQRALLTLLDAQSGHVLKKLEAKR